MGQSQICPASKQTTWFQHNNFSQIWQYSDIYFGRVTRPVGKVDNLKKLERFAYVHNLWSTFIKIKMLVHVYISDDLMFIVLWHIWIHCSRFFIMIYADELCPLTVLEIVQSLSLTFTNKHNNPWKCLGTVVSDTNYCPQGAEFKTQPVIFFFEMRVQQKKWKAKVHLP